MRGRGWSTPVYKDPGWGSTPSNAAPTQHGPTSGHRGRTPACPYMWTRLGQRFIKPGSSAPATVLRSPAAAAAAAAASARSWPPWRVMADSNRRPPSSGSGSTMTPTRSRPHGNAAGPRHRPRARSPSETPGAARSGTRLCRIACTTAPQSLSRTTAHRVTVKLCVLDPSPSRARGHRPAGTRLA